MPLEFKFLRKGINWGILAVTMLRHWIIWVMMLVGQVSRIGSVWSVVLYIVAIRPAMAPLTLDN